MGSLLKFHTGENDPSCHCTYAGGHLTNLRTSGSDKAVYPGVSRSKLQDATAQAGCRGPDVIDGHHANVLTRWHTCAICLAGMGAASYGCFASVTGKRSIEAICLFSPTRAKRHAGGRPLTWSRRGRGASPVPWLFCCFFCRAPRAGSCLLVQALATARPTANIYAGRTEARRTDVPSAVGVLRR
jgi:hypothetical protein